MPRSKHTPGGHVTSDADSPALSCGEGLQPRDSRRAAVASALQERISLNVAGLEIVDLSVALSEAMPKFPADWFPEFAVEEVHPPSTGQSRRFTSLHLFAHGGTHVESSDHVMPQGATIDTVPLRCFAGYPAIVDLRDVPEATEVPLDLVRDRLLPSESGGVILLMTSYDDRKWGQEDFWDRSPWLSVEAAEYIASTKPAVIGLDFQTERPHSTDFLVHRALMAQGAVLCEYLFNLERMDAETLFLALPIKIAGVEAAPVRAVGIKSASGG
jgi:kynurenine formamidase